MPVGVVWPEDAVSLTEAVQFEAWSTATGLSHSMRVLVLCWTGESRQAVNGWISHPE